MSPAESRTELATAVRNVRDELRETQQEFALRMGLSIGAIARYETGAKPNRRTLRAFENLARKHKMTGVADVFKRAIESERNANVVRDLDSYFRLDRITDAFQKVYDRASKIPNPDERTEALAELDKLGDLISGELVTLSKESVKRILHRRLFPNQHRDSDPGWTTIEPTDAGEPE